MEYSVLTTNGATSTYSGTENGNAVLTCTPTDINFNDWLWDNQDNLPSDIQQHVTDGILTIPNQAKWDLLMQNYLVATARLNQYILLDGSPEITEQRVEGMVINPDTGDVTENIYTVVVRPAIAPLPATIEIPQPDGSTLTVPNPPVVEDEEQRAAAQAVVDATPQYIKDAA